MQSNQSKSSKSFGVVPHNMENVVISRILHAGYIFSSGSVQILFDPLFENPFSENCFAFPEIQFDLEVLKKQKFTALFISHYHDDHCSFESLNLIDRDTPIYIYCVHDEMIQLLKQLGFKFVQSIVLNTAYFVGKIKVTARRALDSDVDSIFQIQTGKLNILNVVDSWIDESTMDLLISEKPWDLILWPFQTMREIEVLSPLRAQKNPPEVPIEWLQQLEKLNSRYLVASSCQFIHEKWSWYRDTYFPVSYSYFKKIVHEALPKIEVLNLTPGQSINLSPTGIKSAPALSWVHPVGPQNVDYEYNPFVQVPLTSEIAKNFLPLTTEQTNVVIDYCLSEIPKRLHLLPAPESEYFLLQKIWKLSIYDHDGQARHFNFEINGSRIKSIEDPSGDHSWWTEVPIAKLYGALVNGESLSSMYIRINDQHYSAQIEKELAGAEIMEDPLIRSLFTGKFASYQKAQLARIQVP